MRVRTIRMAHAAGAAASKPISLPQNATRGEILSGSCEPDSGLQPDRALPGSVLRSLTTPNHAMLPAKRSALTPELKAFIDSAIVPALVKAYLAEAVTGDTLASDDVPSDNRAVAVASTEGNR